jgi:peptidoglycan/LPS O-acetylase OafA/YrhL
MFGCWLALVWDREWFVSVVERVVRPWIVAPACLYVLFADPLLFEKFRGYYSLPLGLTLEAGCISLVLIYVVRRPETLAGRVLNLPAIRHIGVMSYSLYLWQQLFTPPGHGLFPLNLLAAFACAELSYRLVERPILQMRDSLEVKMALRPLPKPATSTP